MHVCLLHKLLLQWLKKTKNGKFAKKKALGPKRRCAKGGVSLTQKKREGLRGSVYQGCDSLYVRDVWSRRREWLMFGVQRGRRIADVGGGVKGPKGSG